MAGKRHIRWDPQSWFYLRWQTHPWLPHQATGAALACPDACAIAKYKSCGDETVHDIGWPPTLKQKCHLMFITSPIIVSITSIAPWSCKWKIEIGCWPLVDTEKPEFRHVKALAKWGWQVVQIHPEADSINTLCTAEWGYAWAYPVHKFGCHDRPESFVVCARKSNWADMYRFRFSLSM